MTTKPRKRKKRLSDHAKLVEERARSIPPGVVHELFDTSSFPPPPDSDPPDPQIPPAAALPGRLASKPPPPPLRSGAPGPIRYVSKRPPPPPRPSQRPPALSSPDDELEEVETEDPSDEAPTSVEELDAADVAPAKFDLRALTTEPARTRKGTPAGPAATKPFQLTRKSVAPSATASKPADAKAASSDAPPSRTTQAIVGVLVLIGLGFTVRAELAGRAVSRAKAAASAPAQAPSEPASPAPATAHPPEAPVLAEADAAPALVPEAPVASAAAPVEQKAETSETSEEKGSSASPRSSASSETPAPEASAASPDGGELEELPEEPKPEYPPFNVELAGSAITAAFGRAQGCRSAADPTGVATVTLTYAPSGKVTRALVSGVFAGTSVGSCISAALRSAAIPPFSGELVTVKRSAEIK